MPELGMEKLRAVLERIFGYIRRQYEWNFFFLKTRSEAKPDLNILKIKNLDSRVSCDFSKLSKVLSGA